MAQRPPLSVKIIYALGQLGWSLASFGAANLLVYFYMPPEGKEVIFPNFIFTGAIFGVIALLGLINSGSRIFDAITDPLIANWSDKTTSKFGKRKKFMAMAAIPFAALSFLIFFPISENININTAWLLLTVFLFYLFMTLYVVPYNALISELGHHPDDRLNISTIISVTWAIGFIVGNMAYAIQAYFEQSMLPTAAFQLTMGIFAIVSLIFMLIPVFFLDENKYCEQSPAAINVFDSVKSVFKNRNFCFFSLSDLMYWLALTFIQLGVSYYITVLMQLDKSYATLFSTIGFFASFLLYAPINIAAKKWGKKPLLMIAFLCFCLNFGVLAFIDKLPIPTMGIFYFLALLSAFPLATFGIIPNTIIADIVHDHEEKTGQQQAGMFFAVRAFMMKLGISLANLIFPSLLLFGKSIDNPFGIRLSAMCALFFCILGYFLFLKYKDVSKPIAI